jgi:lipopolysaccharide export system permease protein
MGNLPDISFRRLLIPLGFRPYLVGAGADVSRIDRYLLSQLLQLFGFFALVLVAVYWVNRAVGLFDQLIGDGQSALVFLEFSLLTLPNAIRLVLPVAAFAAAAYVVNRLMQESELVVVQATGFSAFRLARPMAYFGMSVMVMQLVLSNLLVPASQRMLSTRSAEIAENVTARFLIAGQFLHPSPGVALFIGNISPTGELIDLFLSDDRDPDRGLTYFARKAFLVRGETAPKLVMVDGVMQSLTKADGRLALTRFSDFTLDLGVLVTSGRTKRAAITSLPTSTLVFADKAASEAARATIAEMQEEGHTRFASPLMAAVSPILAFAAMMLGGFSRFGLWRQMGLAVGLLILMQLLWVLGGSVAMQTEGAWPMVYLAPVSGLAVALGLLWYGQRPRPVRGVVAWS